MRAVGRNRTDLEIRYPVNASHKDGRYFRFRLSLSLSRFQPLYHYPRATFSAGVRDDNINGRSSGRRRITWPGGFTARRGSVRRSRRALCFRPTRRIVFP